MARSKNKVEDASQETNKIEKLRKVYPFVAGNTKESHKKILHELKKMGAKKVRTIKKCNAVLVFCPIVSRFETDINSALSTLTEKIKDVNKKPKVILVALHHTYNTEYTVPIKRQHSYNGQNIPVVHCLFHETKGFLTCPTNKDAVHAIRKEIGLKKYDRCVIL